MANKHFPHLDRTNDFPYLSNVDVFRFQNEFDYSRWNENSRIRLVNVIWNSDYNDVVKFDTNEDRDEYFDSLSDYQEITLTSKNTRMFPDGSVKLPIPYDVLARYNYLFVDMPIATSTENPIQYEREDGIRRWYFFIDSISYQAPNTTTVFLTPDVWTNFINDVHVNYMMLERGHAPVAFSDTDEYLSNPMENSALLLAPDYDYGRNTIVRDAEFIPFGNGKKWVCVASTCPPNLIERLGEVSYDPDDYWSEPTFEDIDHRWGYQLKVNGFSFGNGYDYSNLRTFAINGASNDNRIFNNLNIYAIPADKCLSGDFFNQINNECPSFMNTIFACFVVDEKMVTLKPLGINLVGQQLYTCVGNDAHVRDIELKKNMFDIPQEYERFAKLYTYPYSYIELTDNDGKAIEVHIEDTSGIGCEMVSSVAFPYLNLRVFFTGIGGVGSSRYSWVNLKNDSAYKDMYDSDWFKYCFDMDIPTYALYMDGTTAYNLNGYNRHVLGARANALVAYQNAVRLANNARANAIDLADTAQSNVNANANTMVANNTNSCNTASANTAITVSTNSANRALANDSSSDITLLTNTKCDRTTTMANSVCDFTVVQENETSIATTQNSTNTMVTTSSINSMQAGVVSGAGLGAAIGAAGGPVGMAGGAAIGGIVFAATGAVTSGLSAGASQTNAQIISQCKQTVADATMEANSFNNGYTTWFNTSVTDTINEHETAQMNNNNACITQQTANNNACATNNTNNTTTTMKANATRTRNTTAANAQWTRNAEVTNQQAILKNAQRNAIYEFNDARNATPISHGTASGSMAPDYMGTRGVQIKVRTQSDSAIRQAGDMFARYGYALNQSWDVRETGLNLMNHFTYWKASDIWLDDRESTTNTVNNVISSIFANGVTVWRNPDEIGRIDIHDN